MTPEQQRIAIAEACGWANIRWNGVRYNWVGHRPETARDDYALPDYLNDLNAMHEAENSQGRYDLSFWDSYSENLAMITQRDDKPIWVIVNCVRATAAQRAEAFLRTLDLWDQ